MSSVYLPGGELSDAQRELVGALMAGPERLDRLPLTMVEAEAAVAQDLIAPARVRRGTMLEPDDVLHLANRAVRMLRSGSLPPVRTLIPSVFLAACQIRAEALPPVVLRAGVSALGFNDALVATSITQLLTRGFACRSGRSVSLTLAGQFALDGTALALRQAVEQDGLEAAVLTGRRALDDSVFSRLLTAAELDYAPLDVDALCRITMCSVEAVEATLAGREAMFDVADGLVWGASDIGRRRLRVHQATLIHTNNLHVDPTIAVLEGSPLLVGAR